ISCSSVVKRPFHFIFFPSSTLFRSEYLLDVFRRVGELPGAKDLFAEGKTLVWNLGPGDAARRLRYFFGERDATTGDLVREFSSPDGDTRFLGDLYQDLSDEAKKRFALLQTPR